MKERGVSAGGQKGSGASTATGPRGCEREGRTRAGADPVPRADEGGAAAPISGEGGLGGQDGQVTPDISRPLPPPPPERVKSPEGARALRAHVSISGSATATASPRSSPRSRSDTRRFPPGRRGTAALTSPSALPIGESRIKSGGAITSTRATASSFSCWETKSVCLATPANLHGDP